MSKGDSYEGAVLAILFTATALANVFDNAATSPITNLYIGLHTASAGDAGSQTTNEATYTGYARKAVARTTSGWTVTGNTCDNDAAITFDPCTAGSNTISHFSVGRDSSAAGYLFYHGALSASLAVSAGITPQFGIGALDVTED